MFVEGNGFALRGVGETVASRKRADQLQLALVVSFIPLLRRACNNT